MNTREKIVETALDLFSEKGFGQTTTREIASRAGVNEITLFRNFGSKEGLLDQVIEHGIDMDGLATSTPIEVTGDIAKDLLSMVIGMKKEIGRRERTYALMLRETMTNEIVRRKLKEIPVRMKDHLTENLRTVIGKCGRDDIDPETAGVFLASYFLRSEFMRMMMGKDPFHEIDERRTKEAISIFLHGYLKKEEDPK